MFGASNLSRCHKLPAKIERWVVDDVDMSAKEFVGGGSFGCVYKVSFRGEECAMKERKDQRVKIDGFLKEIKFLMQVIILQNFLACRFTLFNSQRQLS